MDKLVKTLGITGLSKSQVSRLATDLDEHVEQFRNRPLDDAGPFTFVAADALTMTDTAKYWAYAYPPAKPARPGRSSSLTWSPEASPACA